MSTDVNIERFRAQLGEIAQHHLNADLNLTDVSKWYYNLLTGVLERNPAILKRSSPRYLEIACYRHIVGYMLAKEKGFDCTQFDLNNNDLELGLKAAVELGLPDIHDRVCGDFHDLPFADGYFDLVMISASLHHSRTPETVIGEAMRVLSHGGLFYCQREPCERQFCFYQFNANRPDQHTAFESLLLERDSMRLISSPFPGARNAEVFGRIENDRIPLKKYLTELERYGSIVEQVLYHEGLLTRMDKLILQHCDRSENGLATFIYQLICDEVRIASKKLTKKDKTLGYSLPSDSAIREMAERTASSLKQLPEDKNSIEWQRGMVDLFGGSLRFVVERKADVSSRNGEKNRRPLIPEKNVKLDRSYYASHGIDLWTELLPDIQTADPSDLVSIFPSSSWVLFKNSSGVTQMVSRNISPVINIPVDKKTALVLRYSVVLDESLQVAMLRICCGGKDVEQVVLGQTEDRLLSVVYNPQAPGLQFFLNGMNEESIERVSRIRVSILQCVPIISDA